MTIHMRQLGITVEETTIVYTVLPFVGVIGSPIAGFIADKIGNYKPVLCLSLVVTIITSVCLMFIPSGGDPEIVKRFAFHQSRWSSNFVLVVSFLFK